MTDGSGCTRQTRTLTPDRLLNICVWQRVGVRQINQRRLSQPAFPGKFKPFIISNDSYYLKKVEFARPMSNKFRVGTTTLKIAHFMLVKYPKSLKLKINVFFDFVHSKIFSILISYVSKFALDI